MEITLEYSLPVGKRNTPLVFFIFCFKSVCNHQLVLGNLSKAHICISFCIPYQIKSINMVNVIYLLDLTEIGYATFIKKKETSQCQ